MKHFKVILLTSSFLLFSNIARINAQSITADQNHVLLKALQGASVNLDGFLTEKFPHAF